MRHCRTRLQARVPQEIGGLTFCRAERAIYKLKCSANSLRNIGWGIYQGRHHRRAGSPARSRSSHDCGNCFMSTLRTQLVYFGGALVGTLLSAAAVSAATSFSNPLTGFTGNSTEPGTQAAVATAGFSFASTAGLDPEITMDPTITFGANGATFGSQWGGDGGRNYIRTNDGDYATVNFVAEVTFERNNATAQQVFIGMGTGDIALFGVPDWSTLVSSTFTSPEQDSLTTWRSANDANQWASGPVIPVVGTHRVKMTFDAIAKTMTYAIDLDYAGGAFAADATATPVNLIHIDCPTGCGNPEMPISADFFGPDGWPSEASRIYFGGDDSTIFRDFSVTVSAPPALLGDYNGNNAIDAADYIAWRDVNGTAGPLANDPTPGTVDQTDYTYWAAHFGQTSGAGSALVQSAAVPEPAAIMLLAFGLVAGWAVLRRGH